MGIINARTCNLHTHNNNIFDSENLLLLYNFFFKQAKVTKTTLMIKL